jgi:type I restriction enzyme S subunit
MQKLFSQELRFTDDKGMEFPKWKEKKLSSIMVERNIQEPKSKEYPLMAFIAYKGVTPKGERYNREFLVSDGENKKI